MVFADNVPAALASGAHYESLASGYHLSTDKLAGDFAPVRFERELCVFRKFCARGAVLDVGCSTGGFLHELQRRWPGAYGVVGTDVAGPALDYAEQQGVPVLREPFLTHEFGPGRFDALTLWAVLEHVVEPRAFLAKADGLLRPGGHAFLVVPNVGSLALRTLGARYRYVMPEHVNWFSRQTLRRMASGIPSLEVVKLRSTHFNPVVLGQDFLAGSRPIEDAERARLLRRTNAWKQNRLLRPLRWLYGGAESALGAFGLADNLMAVLRKT
jgi:2-polyprenyl-3-methyl-5-hydroxy-6-metoxy-1,4-benzoquinol methylase